MAKILIIEDNILLRENIADALELEGYKVIHAENGHTGIARAREFNPDLILCDIIMPDMKGYEVLKLLKSDDVQVPFPFIFITALSERKDFREGMELGADDYLVKPFSISELLNAINTQLAKHSSVEKRIRFHIEKIESELKTRISELNMQNESQKIIIDNISATNAQVIGQLNEKQTQLMQEAIHSMETNSTLQNIVKQLNVEIQKSEITEKQKQVMIDLKNKLRKRSVLLNSWTLFQLKFNQTYPNFTSNFFIRFPQLTQQDMIIISSIFINLNTHQISNIIGISPESLRKCKYRLKMKLGLGKEIDLAQFIHEANIQTN